MLQGTENEERGSEQQAEFIIGRYMLKEFPKVNQRKMKTYFRRKFLMQRRIVST